MVPRPRTALILQLLEHSVDHLHWNSHCRFTLLSLAEPWHRFFIVVYVPASPAGVVAAAWLTPT